MLQSCMFCQGEFHCRLKRKSMPTAAEATIGMLCEYIISMTDEPFHPQHNWYKIAKRQSVDRIAVLLRLANGVGYKIFTENQSN